MEEIEQLLTDVIFIEDGRIVLDTPVDAIGDRYAQLIVKADQLATARALNPFSERAVLGRTVLFYENGPRGTRHAGRRRHADHCRPLRCTHAEGDHMNKNNKYLMLARRELWEHRGLWAVPLAAAVMVVCGALFGGELSSADNVHITLNSPMPTRKPGPRWARCQLAGCRDGRGGLSAERKDRSILFWKSLPVSDAETVITKLVVALVVVPLLVLLLAVLLQPVVAGIVALRFPFTRGYVWPLLGGSLAAIPNLIGIGIIGLLWYAPVAAYLMLASVVAKRTPIVYAVVPPVALGVAERIIFGTKHVFWFVGQRLAPFPAGTPVIAKTDNGLATLAGDWWKAFGEPALWLGLLAAAAMIYLVIRLRRYRDDT